MHFENVTIQLFNDKKFFCLRRSKMIYKLAQPK